MPGQRILLDDGKPVRIGSRALDILIALSERAGETISKGELIARVWPDTIVEEANLRVNVAALRKVLGDRGARPVYVANVPGRGYSFIAPVEQVDAVDGAVAPPYTSRNGRLPQSATRVIGREEACAEIGRLLADHRFVTVVGPGGIGKTTAVIAAAGSLDSWFADGVWFVDLVSLPESRQASSVLAGVFGISVFSEDPLPGVAAWLRDKQALIVLDNCEHVIESAALLAETLVRDAPGVSVLATSREALRADGEWQYRLSPLPSPPYGEDCTAERALEYAAVRLFVERAMTRTGTFAVQDADVPAVIEICQKVDGIPLAIELAAATIDLFGLQGLASRLDDHLSVLTRGRRTALPRHQTIRATLDWSYDVLTPSEQAILRRIAVFAGSFNLHSATVVAAHGEIGEGDVIEGVSSLTAKSLLVADTSGNVPRYRLLHLTRTYAREKLRESDESPQAFHRHATYLCQLLTEAEQDWETQTTSEWLTRYARRIDDVRSALDWAFSEGGDAGIGVSLTVLSTVLWIEMSLLHEYRQYVERALEHFATDPDASAELLSQLNAALGNALFHTKGPGADAVAAFDRALKLAEKSGDAASRLRAFSGLCASHLGAGDYAAALSCAVDFNRALGPSPPPAASLISDRLLGLSLSFAGELPQARKIAERLRNEPVRVAHRTRNTGVQFDQRVATGTLLARTLWLQGFQDRAAQLVEETVSDALRIDHAISLCYLLATAAYPVSCWVGDAAASRRYLALLSDHAVQHSLVYWQTWARGYAELSRAADRNVSGAAKPDGWSRDAAAAFGPQLEFFATLSERYAVKFAMPRAERGNAGWATAEILRARAATSDVAADAEALLLRAIELAQQQHALSWELRAETALADLYRRFGRAGMAIERLKSTYARFSEGFDRADLVQARQMMASLETAVPA
jgi:predicted ATPase/DNA-binding winged helix-turn-helix (wHTH) protein